jgi:hypothetical protein
MPKTTAPELTPEQQLAQIAAIFARGVVRYAQTVRRNSSVFPQEVSESAQAGLEVGEKSRLSGSRRHGI